MIVCNRCGGEIAADDDKHVCYLGMDLSSKPDQTALTVVEPATIEGEVLTPRRTITCTIKNDITIGGQQRAGKTELQRMIAMAMSRRGQRTVDADGNDMVRDVTPPREGEVLEPGSDEIYPGDTIYKAGDSVTFPKRGQTLKWGKQPRNITPKGDDDGGET